MRKLEYYWNVVYFGIYELDLFVSNLLQYLNPFSKNDAIKKFYNTIIVNEDNKLENRMVYNRKTGQNILRCQGFMGVLLVVFHVVVINIISLAFDMPILMNLTKNQICIYVYAVIIVALSVLINNLLLFKNDKYLKYFSQFDLLDSRKKRNLYLVSFLSVILIIVFSFLSFRLL